MYDLFTCDTVSREVSWGSLRCLLTRPVPRGALLGRLSVIVALFAWTSLWFAALASALSTTTDSAVGAVAGSIELVIVVQILDAITALDGIRRWVPFHESSAGIGLLATPARYAAPSRRIWLQVPSPIVLRGFAVVVLPS